MNEDHAPWKGTRYGIYTVEPDGFSKLVVVLHRAYMPTKHEVAEKMTDGSIHGIRILLINLDNGRVVGSWKASVGVTLS